ncbi:hypothetical protein [Enterobacter roggenkampii]|uniref:hypothetical protein n=1 Tax=Enterobacter roggenkampii TaxID=1812935 RepID=UPI002FD4FEA1
MSKNYEDLIKNARVNAECGEHMSPAEVTTLLNVVETTLSALAAENEAMKSFGDKLSEMHNDLNGEGTGIQGRAEVACQQVALEAAMDEFDAIKTPATDAFLAEVRAQGVDIAISELNQLAQRSEKEAPIAAEHHRSAALYLQLFAAQLRNGGATEERQSFLSDEDCQAFVKAFAKGSDK